MRSSTQSNSISVREMVIFPMLAAIMFVSKLLMEALPNMHLIGVLTMAYTLVFRKNALIPIYLYVLLNGIYAGFNMWWVPYLYIWTLLWGATMLLPGNMKPRTQCIVYPTVCAIHGLLYGTLYSPAQAIMFGLDFDGMIAWIIAGIPFDLIHAAGNLVLGILIVPIVGACKKQWQGIRRRG